MDEAEQRISDLEDAHSAHRELPQLIQSLNKRIANLENEKRATSLHLVNFPEGAESSDPTSFVENWFADALGPAAFPVWPVIHDFFPTDVPLRLQGSLS